MIIKIKVFKIIDFWIIGKKELGEIANYIIKLNNKIEEFGKNESKKKASDC